MASYFLDSSALVKRYAAETGSAWVESLTDPRAGNRIYVAAIAHVEVVAAIARKNIGFVAGLAGFRVQFKSGDSFEQRWPQ